MIRQQGGYDKTSSAIESKQPPYMSAIRRQLLNVKKQKNAIVQ